MGSISKNIFAIGDSALTIELGNFINEDVNSKVLSLFRSIQNDPLPGVIEAIPAYTSLTIYYDVFQLSKLVPQETTVFDWMSNQIEERLNKSTDNSEASSRLIEVPVCYDKEFAPDIEQLAHVKGITVDEVINIHSSKEYRVYMLGFLPGFSYMGEIDERIAMPRQPQPKPVAAGSIGIAGIQTGIYPLASPGGWQIIGRTPLQLFDPSKEDPTLLKTGDRVRFISISKDEFENY